MKSTKTIARIASTLLCLAVFRIGKLRRHQSSSQPFGMVVGANANAGI